MKMNQKGIRTIKAKEGKTKKYFDKVFQKFCEETSEDEFIALVEHMFMTMSLNVDIKNNENLANNGKIGHVYLVNFGYSIGSETRGWHYCVVIAKAGAVATVVPLSSKAGNKKSPRMSLGIINGLNDKESFALLHNTTTVSGARLKDIKVDGVEVDIKLEKEQLELLTSSLISYLQQSIE